MLDISRSSASINNCGLINSDSKNKKGTDSSDYLI